MNTNRINVFAKWWFLLMGIATPIKGALDGGNHTIDLHYIGGILMIGIDLILHNLHKH